MTSQVSSCCQPRVWVPLSMLCWCSDASLQRGSPEVCCGHLWGQLSALTTAAWAPFFGVVQVPGPGQQQQQEQLEQQHTARQASRIARRRYHPKSSHLPRLLQDPQQETPMVMMRAAAASSAW